VFDRILTLAAGVAVLVLVAAQIVSPAWTFVHGEPYALVLGALLWVLLAYTVRGWRGADGSAGTGFAVSAAGAALIALTGLASGLLGADTSTIARAPGTVVPLPDIGAAAFFPLVDAGGIGRGDARLVLRRRGAAPLEIAQGGRRILGTAVVTAEPHTAAFVEAYDAAGRRLTITQPTNPTFLSPVLQFATTVQIRGRALPADTFATPALHRQISAVYLDASEAQTLGAQRLGSRGVVLFAVRDDKGRSLPHDIGVAESGGTARVDDVRLHVTIGSYPQLVVGSAPLPLALGAGCVAIVAGFVLAWFSQRRSAAAEPAAAVQERSA
jgi:hypothetical protein